MTVIHLERSLRTASCDRPGRLAWKPAGAAAPHRPFLVLLPVGFAVPAALLQPRWALTPPFHPCRRRAGGGLLSVALSLRIAGEPVIPAGLCPAPCFHGARTFLPRPRDLNRDAGSDRPADWLYSRGIDRANIQAADSRPLDTGRSGPYEGRLAKSLSGPRGSLLMRRETLGFLLGFTGVVIFGATLPATRLAVAAFDPWFVTFVRASGAALMAALLLAVLRRPFPRRHGALLAVAALTLVIGFPGFSSLAMTSVPAAHGGVVLGVLPLATAVAAVLVNGERPSPAFWLLALAGTGLVTAFALRQGAGGLAGGIARGDIWLAAAAASAALGYAISGRLARHMPGWEVISWALLLALPVTAPLAAVLWQPAYLAAPAGSWTALSYLAAFSMFLGFFAWNAGLALGGVARVGQVQLLQTFVTLAIAAAILGEAISGEMLAFALAVSAIVLLGRKARVGRA